MAGIVGRDTTKIITRQERVKILGRSAKRVEKDEEISSRIDGEG